METGGPGVDKTKSTSSKRLVSDSAVHRERWAVRSYQEISTTESSWGLTLLSLGQWMGISLEPLICYSLMKPEGPAEYLTSTALPSNRVVNI